MIQLTRTTKLMCAGVALSMGWMVLEACSCDDEDDFLPGTWVECVDGRPTLMNFLLGDIGFFAGPFFSEDEWDCTHPNSPHYQGSEAAAFAEFAAGAPSGAAQHPHLTGSTGAAYLPQRLRDLPFTPTVAAPGSAPACDSSYPDVLQTDHNEAQITRISTCPFAIKAKIPVVSRPLQVAVTPDGGTALVTSFDNAVNFIDLKTNKVVFTLMTDLSINPDGLAISPDGSRAYVTSFTDFNPVILVVDVVARKAITTIPTFAYAQGATLTPDGSQLWITSPLGNETDVIDTLTNTTTYRLNIGVSTAVAFNSTGTMAYVTSGASTPGKVIAVDTATFQTKTTYTVGQDPADIAMSYGDRFLVVNNSLGGSVSVINLQKNTVISKSVGGTPSGIAFVH
jgi:hypothetical protein